MASRPVLRPYQTTAISELRRKIASGKRRVVLCLACGGGKTLVSAEIVRLAVERGNRVVFIAHRRELIKQAADKFSRFGIESGIIMGQSAGRDDWLPVQICSVATLARRMDHLPPGQIVIVDEVHHGMSESYRRVLDAYAGATVIGLTATPWRSDKQGLADIFDDHVVVATVSELTAQGHLVPADVFAYSSPELHKVKVTAGDYNQKQLADACNTQVLVGSIVKEYLAHAAGRPAIVFPVSIAHSQAVVAEFMAAGVLAAHVDCHMVARERDAALASFAGGTITVLSSVGILGEGWDSPNAEVAILARPTKSLSLYLQQAGRVLRPSPKTGKTRALIHDHAGNTVRFGFLDDERSYSLTSTPTRERDMFTCPLCNAIFGSIGKDGLCPRCHQPIAPKASPASEGEGRQFTIVDGERIDRAAIEKLRAARGSDLAKHGYRDLTDAELVRASRATKEQKIAEYLRLRAVAERKGLQPGFVSHQYKSQFGVWPAQWEAEDIARVAPATSRFLPLPRSR